MFTFLELQSHVIFENIEYQKATQTNQTHVKETAFLAQMAERLPSKQKVASSILAEGNFLFAYKPQ